MDTQQALLNLMMDAVARIDNNRSGQVVADLAIITLIIDAEIATIGQVCERLELIQSSLGGPYQSDEAKQRTQLLIQWLRGHEKHSSHGWSPQVIEGGKDQT